MSGLIELLFDCSEKYNWNINWSKKAIGAKMDPLTSAVYNGNFGVVQKFLESKLFDINYRTGRHKRSQILTCAATLKNYEKDNQVCFCFMFCSMISK